MNSLGLVAVIQRVVTGSQAHVHELHIWLAPNLVQNNLCISVFLCIYNLQYYVYVLEISDSHVA